MSVKWIQERPDGKRALYTFDILPFLELCSEAKYWGLEMTDSRMNAVFEQYLQRGKVRSYRLTNKTAQELREEIKRNFPGSTDIGEQEEGNGP